MPRHSKEANALRKSLDSELAAVANITGGELVWDATELALLELIATAVDRQVDLRRDYAEAENAKTRLKIATELRLIESHLARLLKQVKVEAPKQDSLTTIKARNAVNVRWANERARNAATG
jgi:hypothetical protein